MASFREFGLGLNANTRASSGAAHDAIRELLKPPLRPKWVVGGKHRYGSEVRLVFSNSCFQPIEAEVEIT